MRLIVTPEAYHEQVEHVVRYVIEEGHRGGTEELTLTVRRRMVPVGWSVEATGLGDPVLEASYCDVVTDALKRALP